MIATRCNFIGKKIQLYYLIAGAIGSIFIFGISSCQKSLDFASLKVEESDLLLSSTPLNNEEMLFKHDSLILYVLPTKIASLAEINWLKERFNLVFSFRGQTPLILAKQNNNNKGLNTIFKRDSYPLKINSFAYKSYLKNNDYALFIKILARNTSLLNKKSAKFDVVVFAYNKKGELINEGNINTISIRNNDSSLGYARNRLNKFIETYFPIKGLVIQVRGGQKAAKISVGRSAGTIANQKFALYDRDKISLKEFSVLRNNHLNFKSNKQIIELVAVEEDESWFYITQPPIKIGDIVISIP
ncbi:MAG: hypothetical protein JJV97_04385 [SAR324 cluster bacterium]|nr:hypothetical protein [SAR324 cluster bacterium]